MCRRLACEHAQSTPPANSNTSPDPEAIFVSSNLSFHCLPLPLPFAKVMDRCPQPGHTCICSPADIIEPHINGCTGGGGISSGDNFVGTISRGENFGTPPILERDHQTRETSTPPSCQKMWPFFTLEQGAQTFSTTTNFSLPSEQDERAWRTDGLPTTAQQYRATATREDAQGAGSTPNGAKKIHGENFSTKLANEIPHMNLSPYEIPPPPIHSVIAMNTSSDQSIQSNASSNTHFFGTNHHRPRAETGGPCGGHTSPTGKMPTGLKKAPDKSILTRRARAPCSTPQPPLPCPHSPQLPLHFQHDGPYCGYENR